MLRSCLLALTCLVVGLSASAADRYVTVTAEAESYWPVFHAYAQVVPIQLLAIKAGTDGVLEGLSVVPGQHLAAGAVIGRIGGADQAAAMQEAQAKLAAAEQGYRSARDLEQSLARTYPKFADRAQLDRARADRAAAEAQLNDARAELVRLQALSTVTSPTAGEVISLQSATGDRVSAGSVLLKLQPEHDLWLRAIFYDLSSGVLAPGRKGRFVPATGEPVPVSLMEVVPVLRPDGGVTVTFDAAGAPGWRAGESGEVVVEGEPHQAVTVPTEALIFEQGKWWVLAEERSGGLRRLAVRPGPAEAGKTVILAGLKPGTAVVVRDAYLLFHRDFSQHYVPPD